MYTDKHIQFINKHEFLSNSACSLIFTVVWSSHNAEKNPSPAEALRELEDVCWRLTGAALPSQWKLLPVPVQSNRYGCKPQTTESCCPRRQLFHGFYYFKKLKLVMYLLYGAHQGQLVDLTGQGYFRDPYSDTAYPCVQCRKLKDCIITLICSLQQWYTECHEMQNQVKSQHWLQYW